MGIIVSLLRSIGRLLGFTESSSPYRVSADRPVENLITPGLLYQLLRPARWQTV